MSSRKLHSSQHIAILLWLLTNKRCGSCPHPACPSSCRMRCRFCHGVCAGQASQLDSCPSLSPRPLSSSPPSPPTTTTTRRPLPALEGDAVMGMGTDLQDWFPSH